METFSMTNVFFCRNFRNTVVGNSKQGTTGNESRHEIEEICGLGALLRS